MSSKYNEDDILAEFKAVDTNQSGTLSMEELKTVFIKLGDSPADAEVYAQVSNGLVPWRCTSCLKWDQL